jgi:hypothetical protein
MPKIPTFTTSARPTAEVGSVQSNIQIGLNQTIGSALAPVTQQIVDYKVKQKDFENKTEALKLENDFIRDMSKVYDEVNILENEDQAQNILKNKSNILVQKYSNLASNKNSQILFNQYALAEIQKGIFRTSSEVQKNTLLSLDNQVFQKVEKLMTTAMLSKDSLDYKVLEQDVKNTYITNYQGKVSNALLTQMINAVPDKVKTFEATQMISKDPRKTLAMLKDEKQFVGLTYNSRSNLIEQAQKTLAPIVQAQWEDYTTAVSSGKDVEPFDLKLAQEVLETPVVNKMIEQESIIRETSDNVKIILGVNNKIVNEVTKGFIDEAEQKFGEVQFQKIKSYYEDVLERRNTDLNKDPVDFLMRTNPEIESLTNELSNQKDEQIALTLQKELANTLIKKQNEIGIHSSKQKVMTNEMATSFINKYKQASIDKNIDLQFAMLEGLSTQYGDLESKAFSQLMYAGLPQGAKFLSSNFATREDAMKILSLDQPEKIQALKNFLNDSDDTDVSFSKMRIAIRQSSDFKDIENIIRRNVPFDTGESSLEMENIVDFLALYGANEFYAGDVKTFKQAADNAALMFTKNFDIEDTYFFPKTYQDSITKKPITEGKMERIKLKTELVKNHYLSDFKAVAYNSKKDGVEEADLTERMEFNMKENGEWRNSSDGTGLVYGIVLSGNSFGTIVNQAGQELFIAFDDDEMVVPGTNIPINPEIEKYKEQSRGYFGYEEKINEKDFSLGKRPSEIPDEAFK